MKRPNAFQANYWREEGVVEGAILRTVFSLLLIASGLILALDLRDMMDRASGGDGGHERTEQVVITPPAKTDHVRPYYPKAMPVLPGAKAPKMPGLSQRPTAEMVAAKMSFQIDDGGQVSAIGRIEPGTAGDFEKFIKETDGKAKRIWFLSPGGSVADAISIGQTIRSKNLDTVVAENAYCASSCPLAFAGGVVRNAGPRSWIGVHQVYATPQESGNWHQGIAVAQQISAECEEHLVKMGIDPRAWIKAMKTSKDQIYIFTTDELTEFHIATALDVPRV